MIKRMGLKTSLFFLGFLLSGCDIPLIFWEEEGRKLVDEVVDEEEKLHPLPQKQKGIYLYSRKAL